MRIPKVSIILPCYNVEKYIAKCIQSLLDQTYKDFELLVIIDGSPDNSKSIAESYTDSRITILEKENGGVSSARNLGISKASGDYVCFIDADDWVENDFLQNLMDNSGEDLIVSGYKSIFENKTIVNKHDSRKLVSNCFFKPDELLKSEGFILYNTPCSKLFKLYLLNQYQIRFNEQLSNGEDFIFNLQYGLKCKTILFHKYTDCCYNKINESSATTKYVTDYYNKVKATKDAFFDIICEYRTVTKEERYYQYFRVASKAIFEEGKKRNSFIIKYKKIKTLLRKEEIDFYIRNFPRKKSKESRFFDSLQRLMKMNQPFLLTLLLELYYKSKHA